MLVSRWCEFLESRKDLTFADLTNVFGKMYRQSLHGDYA